MQSSSSSAASWSAVEAVAREMEIDLAEALDLISKEPESDSVEVEAKYIVEVVAPNDAMLTARSKLACIRSRPAEASGGGRARLQQRS